MAARSAPRVGEMKVSGACAATVTWAVALPLALGMPARAQAGAPASVEERPRLGTPAGEAGFGEHFFVRSADGLHELELGALLQVHARAFERGLAARESDVFLRRFRLEIGGRIDGEWRFNLEPKFTEDEFEFEEAWFGADAAGGVRVMVGRMKEPFSLEEMRSQKHMGFVEFSLLNQLVPAEGHGVTLAGARDDRALQWGAALYRGGAEGLNGGSEAAGRLVARPFHDGPPLLRELALGAAATWGRAHDELGGEELRTEARVPFATLDPAAAADGTRSRVGAELEWRAGPCELTGEAMVMERRLEGPLRDARARVEGGTLAFTWVLTGEARGAKGVAPARPFSPRGGGGGGALELAARASRLRFGDGWAASGALPPASDPRRVTSYDLGLNWYATARARLELHGVLTRYGRDVLLAGERVGDELALLAQFQLHF